MHRILLAVTLSLLALCGCNRTDRDADWPVYQGSDNHDHYVTLSQITPANVAQLEVAWKPAPAYDREPTGFAPQR